MGNLVVVFLRVFLVIWRSVVPLGRRSANTPGQRRKGQGFEKKKKKKKKKTEFLHFFSFFSSSQFG